MLSRSSGQRARPRLPISNAVIVPLNARDLPPSPGYARDRAPASWWNGTSRVAFPVLRRARRGRTGTAQNQVVLRIDGHSASQRLSSQISINFCVSERIAPDDRDDRYSAASRLIYICSFIYAWARKRVAVFSWKHCDGWHGWAPPCASCRSSTGSGTRSIAARLTRATGASGRAGWPTGWPTRTCPLCGWTARSGAHASAAYAPKNESRTPPSAAAEAASAPQIHILADCKGRPLHLRVSGGQHLDSTQARIRWKPGRTRRGLA